MKDLRGFSPWFWFGWRKTDQMEGGLFLFARWGVWFVKYFKKKFADKKSKFLLGLFKECEMGRH